MGNKKRAIKSTFIFVCKLVFAVISFHVARPCTAPVCEGGTAGKAAASRLLSVAHLPMASIMAELVVGSLIDNYDKRNETVWHKEDIEHRHQERQWRIDDLQRERDWRLYDIRTERIRAKLDNEQRHADTRAEHLSAISELAAELGGFALVSIINVNLPVDIDLNLLWVYGITSALTICCMILSLIVCTVLMLAVTHYCAFQLERDVKNLDDDEVDVISPFAVWWIQRCESDWQLGYYLFRTGVKFFFAELAVVSWVQYNMYEPTSISITVVAFVGLLIWQTRIWSKWRYLMRMPDIDDIDGPNERTPLKKRTSASRHWTPRSKKTY
ncbi:Aste57867_22126 [Aphanomyces stellatus]|uniref:Aste57867_22126 protein n=1 Tax=Aphanomyces stellatus TaxID=120398 RepID=A0A485LJC5_9STRA|nr:hypothetical protein As57867_022057 [Aphanomyces stellatus]VFT98794.1 Aste57867_22126 [Aphanomyces stellatus]